MFFHNHVEYVKFDLGELESTKNHLGLIFNKCLNLEKALPCYFYHINSIILLGLRLVGLVRAFHKLSNNTKFIKFGPVDLLKFKFEVRI
jgi:hypothetical protein